MAIKRLTKEGLKSYHQDLLLTVGDLKRVIENHNLRDDVIIMVERVPDMYYEENGWGVYVLPNRFGMTPTEDMSEEDTFNLYEQYHPAYGWRVVNEDKDDFLFIDMFY